MEQWKIVNPYMSRKIPQTKLKSKWQPKGEHILNFDDTVSITLIQDDSH